MSKFIYNLSVISYGLAVRLSSPFNQKASEWVEGRKNWKSKLIAKLETLNRDKPVVWFHVSSLGEFEQGRPVMEALKKENEINLILTFFSPSGYKVMKKWLTADLIFYLPLDSKKNAVDFIGLIKPSIAVFVKYEFWYHYLKQLNDQKITTFVISARFYADQLFFKSWAKWYAKVLFLIDKIYVQDITSEKLLKSIGYNSVDLSGDTRYDRVSELSKHIDRFLEIEDFTNGEKLFVTGSSWPLDEEIISKYINENPNKYKYLIAPHDISENHLKKIEKSLDVPFKRYSNYKEENDCNVLILDNIGMLSRVYKYANIAFIGGAFKEGLHNILEPAAYGVPIITGPNHDGFPEGPAMEKVGGLVRIKDFEEFSNLINQWGNDEENRKKAALATLRFIEKQTGATIKITRDIEMILSDLKKK
jgi:3-deoxy-D-manno-octulosonic-acid transferase